MAADVTFVRSETMVVTGFRRYNADDHLECLTIGFMSRNIYVYGTTLVNSRQALLVCKDRPCSFNLLNHIYDRIDNSPDRNPDEENVIIRLSQFDLNYLAQANFCMITIFLVNVYFINRVNWLCVQVVCRQVSDVYISQLICMNMSRMINYD